MDEIIVENRIRTEAGDLTELVKDIEENGLINPVLVTKDKRLIAGFRRYCAHKKLGRNKIEARIMPIKNALHELKLEIAENEVRKDFTFSERMKYAKMLEEEYSQIAKKNQSHKIDPEASGANDPLGRVRDVVAKELNYGSGTTFQRGKYVYDNADDDMIRALDDEKLSINKAYTILKEQKRKAENKAKELEEKLTKQSMDFDQERADAARRIEKQIRRAEALETDLNVVKRLGDPELVKEVDKWKGKCSSKDGEIQKLEAALSSETKRNQALLKAQGYAEKVEEERDELLVKVQRLQEEIDKHDNAFTSIEDVVMLITDIEPKLDDILRYASVENADSDILSMADRKVSVLINKLNDILGVLRPALTKLA